MQILFVIPAYTPFVGGAQSFARAMIRRLTEDGHRVTVLTTTAQCADDFWRRPQGPVLLRHDQIDGADVVRLPIRYPWPSPYRFGVLRRAGHWLQRSRLPASIQCPLLGYFARSMPPLTDLQSTVDSLIAQVDLIHAIDASWDGPFTAASQAARATGKSFVAMPLVHTGSADILAHATMLHQRAAYHHAAAVIALTEREKDLLSAQGIPRDQIHVLAMGVEGDAGATLPAEVQPPPDLAQPFLLFLGAATYDKGAFTLARTVAHLHRQGIDIWVACAGPQQQQLGRMIEGLPDPDRQLLRERVRLLGIVDESTKAWLLSRCTALALPSRVDAFGIVLLEAWQHGKPVIAAAEGGLIEIVAHEENGLLVPFDDVAALSKAITRLRQNPTLARHLGAEGKRQVQSRYTWDHTYGDLRRLYEEIYRTKGGGPIHRVDVRDADKLSAFFAARARAERDGGRG